MKEPTELASKTFFNQREAATAYKTHRFPYLPLKYFPSFKLSCTEARISIPHSGETSSFDHHSQFTPFIPKFPLSYTREGRASRPPTSSSSPAVRHLSSLHYSAYSATYCSPYLSTLKFSRCLPSFDDNMGEKGEVQNPRPQHPIDIVSMPESFV
jgi:hypothetical protein